MMKSMMERFLDGSMTRMTLSLAHSQKNCRHISTNPNYMSITLMRHAKPVIKCWQWISPIRMKHWIKAYNTAAIETTQPPFEAILEATKNSVIITSSLPRSIQSANLLPAASSHLIEPLLNEAELPYCNLVFPKLPAMVWGFIFRILWFLGYHTHAISLEETRKIAHEMALRLITLAKEYENVLVVGHGIMNALIAKELLALGWQTKHRPKKGYWSYQTLSKES